MLKKEDVAPSRAHLPWNDGKHRRCTNFDDSLVPADGRWFLRVSRAALVDQRAALRDGRTAPLTELAAEQRLRLHSRLTERRVMQGEWVGAEVCCRAALLDPVSITPSPPVVLQLWPQGRFRSAMEQ